MSADHFKTLVGKAASASALTGAEAAEAFDIIMDGKAPELQVAAFLTALHMRGETIEEIAAAADALRARALTVDAPPDAIDTCGTGGDGLGTLNISTAAAIVTAACGVKVAKHGNRALSSKSGSADVLTALGVKIDLTPQQVSKCIDEAGLGFLFAPAHHSAMKHVAIVRQQLGFRTIFNLLGPLCNPARVKKQLVGVFADKWLEPLAHVLHTLGTERAWVVHGADGLDELTVTGPSHIAELNHGQVRRFTISPADAGLSIHRLDKLFGGDATENAAAMTRLFAGEPGAYRDIVCLNAGGSLVVAGKAGSLREGVERAQKVIDSGEARAAAKRARHSPSSSPSRTPTLKPFSTGSPPTSAAKSRRHRRVSPCIASKPWPRAPRPSDLSRRRSARPRRRTVLHSSPRSRRQARRGGSSARTSTRLLSRARMRAAVLRASRC
jgi:anthranilate phosphoribosyltransferase